MTNKEAIARIKNHIMIHSLQEPRAVRISEALSMAIKALEQSEPCEDAVSRSGAIIQLLHNKIGDDDCDVVIQRDVETIRRLPSIKPKQRWIPCSERLPDYMTAVLTWDGAAYAVEKRIQYITDEDGEHITSEWWVSDDFDEENTEHYPNLRDGAAIAWMPLPEAYKEVEG